MKRVVRRLVPFAFALFFLAPVAFAQSAANAGFDSVKFQRCDVIHDLEATNFTSTNEKGYFINTDYLELVVHRDANWTTLDDKMSINQDAVVIPVIWQGQLVCSNRALQGALIDAS